MEDHHLCQDHFSAAHHQVFRVAEVDKVVADMVVVVDTVVPDLVAVVADMAD